MQIEIQKSISINRKSIAIMTDESKELLKNYKTIDM